VAFADNRRLVARGKGVLSMCHLRFYFIDHDEKVVVTGHSEIAKTHSRSGLKQEIKRGP
jgi:hypothetical protein